jgi:hypothetical protein
VKLPLLWTHIWLADDQPWGRLALLMWFEQFRGLKAANRTTPVEEQAALARPTGTMDPDRITSLRR